MPHHCHCLLVTLSLVLVAFSLTFQQSQGAFINLKVYENDWLKKILSDPLNNVQVRPTILNTSEPIEISVSLLVQNFEEIDDKKQEFSVQIILRQEWEDDRLAYGKFNPVQLRQLKFLTLLDTDKVWKPDTFFKNEKQSSIHSNMKTNNFIRIFPNGTLVLDTRISLTLSCPMNLKYFPFESTICTLQIASYAFARDDLIYKWKANVPAPITVRPFAEPPPGFLFTSATSNYCDSQSGIGGVVSCLLGEFHFRRSSSFFLKQGFVPLANLVLMTWFSFLLDFRSERTLLLRALLILVTFSTAFSLLSNTGRIIPRTSYSTAFDFWTGISLTFIFSAFLELMAVHYLTTNCARTTPTGVQEGGVGSSTSSKRNSTFDDQIEMTATRAKLQLEGSSSVNIEPENVEGVGADRKPSSGSQGGHKMTSHWTQRLSPERIEKWAKILYPALYSGFNLIFWLVCSNSGDH